MRYIWFGLPKVLWASLASASTKLIGKKGVFYKIVGQEVSGLDGFYNHVWEEYGDIGIKLPENPSRVCDEVKEKLGISLMIVDANDLGQEILGHSKDIKLKDEELKELIKDNPSGQGKELTPIILIRKKDMQEYISYEYLCNYVDNLLIKWYYIIVPSKYEDIFQNLNEQL